MYKIRLTTRFSIKGNSLRGTSTEGEGEGEGEGEINFKGRTQSLCLENLLALTITGLLVVVVGG